MIFTSTGNNQNNGISYSVNGSPFKPNTMVQGSIFSNALHLYKNDAGLGSIRDINSNKKVWNNSAEQHIMYKKIQAIGKNRTKAGLSPDAALSYKSVDNTSMKSAIARVRAGGSVAPKKKSSV